MSSAHCLPDPALWPATAGEELAPTVAEHLQACAHCSARVTQLREQRRQLLAAADAPAAEFAGGREHGGFDACVASAACDPVTSIGGYQVQRLLSVGGQADVYLARHPTLCTSVVVKWAHQTLHRSPGTARRFADEAQLLAELRHRSLVRVYDVGIAEGRPFLVMEYVAGSVLSRTGARPMPPCEATAIVAGIARALHAVHDAGRLHLDVQPDNILVDGDGTPRLIDFGMSARRGAAADCPQGVPHGGTPEYMAPEQLAADMARIDVRSDVYALGAVLHELLTGSPPQPEWLWSGIAHAPHVSAAPAVPPALRRICRRALDPQPARRYASALEFSRALEQFATGGTGSIFAVAAGLLTLALLCGGLWAVMPPAVHHSSQKARIALIPGEPAAAVELFLEQTADGRRSVTVFLQNGRCVPVGVERSVRGDGSPPPERIPELSRELLAMRGTFLVASRPVDPGSGLPAARPALSPLPPLPAGTMAHVTGDRILVVQKDGTSVSRSVRTMQVRQLRRVQAELRMMASQFDALLIATDGASDPPPVAAVGSP